MLTLVQDKLLLAKLPSQAASDADYSLKHFHTILEDNVCPDRLRLAQLSQPDRARQRHICEKSQKPSDCQRAIIYASKI